MRKRLLLHLPRRCSPATASVATAQVVNNDHDRGPLARRADRPPLWAPSSRASSGRRARSARRTRPCPIALPDTVTMTINVPDGQSRCVRVLFTAETSCTGFAGAPTTTAACRRTIDGVPDGSERRRLHDDRLRGRERRRPRVRVDQARRRRRRTWSRSSGDVGNAATTFTHDDWTLDVALKALTPSLKTVLTSGDTGPVGQVDVGRRFEQDGVGSRPRGEVADVGPPERLRAAQGGGADGLVGRHAHLAHGDRDAERDVRRVARAGVAVGGEGDGDAGVDQPARVRVLRAGGELGAGQQGGDGVGSWRARRRRRR